MQALKFTRVYLQLWVRHQIGMRSAALTYTTMLAMIPLIAVGLAAVTALVDVRSYSQDLRMFLLKNLTAGSGNLVSQYIDQILNKVRFRTIGIVGFSSLVVTALLMISSVESTLNRVWSIRKPKDIFSRFALYNLFLLLAPISVAASIAATTFVVKFFPGKVFQAQITAVIITTVFVTFVYKLFPNTKVHAGWSLLCAFLVAFLIEVAKVGYGFYTSKALIYNKVYGGLAVLPLFLLWLYLNWNIFLGGSLLNYALQNRKRLVPPASILLLLSLSAEAADSATASQWYLHKTPQGVAAAFQEEVEERKKSNEFAVSQRWFEGSGREVYIGSVAKNEAGYPPVAFYVEVKEGAKSYTIDARAVDQKLTLKIRHRGPVSQPEEQSAIALVDGLLLSLFLPWEMSRSATPQKPLLFNAVVEDIRDGVFEARVGRAENLGKTRLIGGKKCHGYRVTFQEIKSSWWVEKSGRTCEVEFPGSSNIVAVSAKEAAKWLPGAK